MQVLLRRFAQAVDYTSTPKIIALSENGALLDPDRWAASAAAWSWFCVWSGDNFVVEETWNENPMKQLVYASEHVLTLDELPALTTYPLP